MRLLQGLGWSYIETALPFLDFCFSFPDTSGIVLENLKLSLFNSLIL